MTNAMNPILIVYASRYGHTHQIAEHLAGTIRTHGRQVFTRDVGERGPIDLSGCGGVILAASVYMGRHQKEMLELVQRRRAELRIVPTAFISVSMSAAEAQDSSRTPEQRQRAARDVARTIEEFFERTRWRPDRVSSVAGALEYTRYNVLVRWMMKRIARKSGADTDTSRDHIYTDWEALDRFAAEFVAMVEEPAPARI